MTLLCHARDYSINPFEKKAMNLIGWAGEVPPQD